MVDKTMILICKIQGYHSLFNQILQFEKKKKKKQNVPIL